VQSWFGSCARLCCRAASLETQLGSLQLSPDPLLDIWGALCGGNERGDNEGREEMKREGRDGEEFGRVGPPHNVLKYDD